MNFDPHSAGACFVSEDGTVKIEKDTEVRLKIVGSRVDADAIVSIVPFRLTKLQFSIGTIKEDFLGVI
jgi:DNA-directed RNA polymerase II subunit RPB7